MNDCGYIQYQEKSEIFPTCVLIGQIWSLGCLLVLVAGFLRALHWPCLTLPPLASQLVDSEEKTCFVPVYFVSGPKVGPLAGSIDVHAPTV